MLQKTAAISWVPLSEGFAHVFEHERDRWVTERLLRHALADGKVRARGYVVFDGGENVVEPLPRRLFTIFDEERSTTAEFNTEANSIRHVDGWYPENDCTIYRVELAWNDLVAIWPEMKKRSRAGRKPLHDRDVIMAVAENFLRTGPRPKSVNQFATKIEKVLREKSIVAPGRTYLTELLGPLLESSAN